MQRFSPPQYHDSGTYVVVAIYGLGVVMHIRVAGLRYRLVTRILEVSHTTVDLSLSKRFL